MPDWLCSSDELRVSTRHKTFDQEENKDRKTCQGKLWPLEGENGPEQMHTIFIAFPGLSKTLAHPLAFLSLPAPYQGENQPSVTDMPMTQMDFPCKKQSTKETLDGGFQCWLPSPTASPGHPALCSWSPDKPFLLTKALTHNPSMSPTCPHAH